LRYSTVYGYYPESNKNLDDIKFEIISIYRPLLQLKLDTEYINELFSYLENHKGWLDVDNKFLDFLKDDLEI